MTGLSLPAFPQPDPLPQPGPDWLLWGLLVLTFVVHLIAMNVLVGGSLIAAVARWRSRHGGDRQGHLEAMSSLVARGMPVALALTVTFGVAPLLFVQVLYGRLFFSSSILMGWYWLGVVGLVIAAYGATYRIAFRWKAGHPPGTAIGFLAVVLLVAVAFIYVNNMSLIWRPAVFVAMYRESATGLHLNLTDPTLVPRFLHMALGAVAVGGAAVAVMGLAVRRPREPLALVMVRHGARWFVAATSANVLVGFWWLAALPRDTLSGFMRSGLTAPLVLLVGIVAGIGALALMVSASRAERPWAPVRMAAWHMVAVMALMAVSRDQFRQVALASAGFLPRAWVEPQWGAIGVFAGLLVVALISVGWMVTALARGQRGVAAGSLDG
jgi:hypothetical protein